MKTSNLTRSVFRAIVNDRPYAIRGCEQRTTRLGSNVPLRPFQGLHQRRHFFGLNIGSVEKTLDGAKPTAANVELALGKLVDLARARRTNSRLPFDSEIVDAFRFLFASRLDSPRHLTRNEVFLATEAFKHLQERDQVLKGDGRSSLLEDDLNNVLLALASSTGRDRYRSDAKVLATAVFEVLRGRSAQAQDLAAANSAGQYPVRGSLLATYISVLSKTGSAQDGLDLLRRSNGHSERTSLPVWTAILRGLASEGRLQEFWDLNSEITGTVGPLDALSHEVLATFLAEHDEVGTLKKFYNATLEDGQVPTTVSIVKTVDCCIRNGELEWAAPLVKDLHGRTDNGDLAGTLLLWYAVHDDDVSHLRRRLEDVMDAGMTDALSMRTVNRIVEYAYQQHKPDNALRYIQLAEELGLTPDVKTRSLQLDYEQKQGNRREAALAFNQLALLDTPVERYDVPVLNRYIAGLAFSADHDYHHLLRVVDHVLESGADLDAEALAGVCHVFLEREELEEAMGLLRHRVDSLPMDDRARIAAVFLKFIPDPEIKAQRAYDAYDLFRHAFPETSVSDRLPLMQSFFDRNRPDLACLVFGHMRQREDRDARPTPDAYAQCFAGIAKCKDVDGLQMVYNMLKLDLEVEQTTRIHNSLMAAYTECQQPFVAIIDHFWKVMESREGPTLSSFQLALRACEKWIPQGGHEARHLIALMQSLNLRITKEVYDLYIGALAGQSEFENVVELIDTMLVDIGEHPDAFTIGTFYNAIPWQFRKDEVEQWAKEAYPEEWAELESYGDEIDEEWEIRYFNIDRNRDIDMDDDLLFAEGQYEPQIATEKHQSLEMPKH